MRKINAVVMTLAGLLVIVAAILKFHEMLTTCIPSWTDNKYGFWESYEFFLVQIPFEFALGVWLVSGLFRKAAWIAGALAYFGFIFVTIFKIVVGAESCGCFGQVTVNPWITLFAIDVPFLLLLLIFRPKGLKLLPPPWPNTWRLLAVAVPTIGLMVLSTPALVAFKPDCIKAEEVKPDETSRKALQEYLRKQKEPKEQPQTQAPQNQPASAVQAAATAPAAPQNEYSYGKLNVKATDLPDIFTFQIDQKQAFALNFTDSDKILITPLDPVNQQLALLPNGIEINWQTEPVVRPVAVADPNVTVSEIAERQPVQQAPRNTQRSGSNGSSPVEPMMPPMPGSFFGGGTESFNLPEGQDAQPVSEEPVPQDPNDSALSNDSSSGRQSIFVTQSNSAPEDPNAAEPGTVEPNTVVPETDDPATVEPNTIDDGAEEPNTITPTDEIPQWEWLQYVVEENLRSQMAQGLTVVLMYHHDCPTCAEMAPKYSDYCRQMSEQGNEEFKIVFLAVPPYAETGPIPADTTCLKGTLTDQQNWQIMSPYVVALLDGQLVKTWEQGTAPEPENIIDEIMAD